MTQLTASVVLAGFLLGVVGCITPPSGRGFQEWSYVGSAEEPKDAMAFEYNRSECNSASTVPASIVSSRGNTMAVELDERMFNECMQQRGWKLKD